MGRRKLIRGETDLATLFPALASQWHPTNNGDLVPEDVLPGTETLIWWRCDKGHDWQAPGYRRVQRPNCPVCSGRKVLSGTNDLATTHPELAAQWHPTRNGILTPSHVGSGSGFKAWWQCNKGHEWMAAIGNRTAGAGCPVCVGQAVLAGYNDMATTNPELAAQWHPTRNGTLTPTMVMAGTNKSLWWQCNKGHEWQAKGNGRVRGTGCPICSSSTVLGGFNDLATTHPELAAQWHPIKNGKLTPAEVIAGTGKRIWWQCNKGHEWIATGAARVKGSGCSICTSHQVLAGFNDLATTHPELAAQWHPIKNGKLTPAEVIAGTGKRIWWQCHQGHEWSISGSARVRGSGCPYCSGRFAIVGENDLATVNPLLAAQWHPTKNGNLQPSDVKGATNQRVWWACDKGHEWKSTVASRFAGTGCPICSSSTVLGGFNDLATTHPELAAQWHPIKNGKLTPAEVIAGTGKRIWWQCNKGHEWIATGAARVKGSGCSICTSHQVLAGFNDLATTHPELAAQWHPTKNGNFRPNEVSAGSSKRAWWQCNKGHEWVSICSHRAKGSGCPVCSGRQVVVGYNDLATSNPELAAQWHPIKNGALTPEKVVSGSNQKAWWLCVEGHDWCATISSRNNGNGCSVCAQRGFDPSKPAILYFIANRELYARKIGITNVGTTRLATFAKTGWHQVLTVENANGSIVRTVESALFEWLRGQHALPQHLVRGDMPRTGGWTETFSEEGPSDHEIMERIRAEFARQETPKQ